MAKRKVFQEIALKQMAIENCEKSFNSKMAFKHTNAINDLVSKGPQGGGLDFGPPYYDHVNSNHNRLIFHQAWHNMNEDGYYDGVIHFIVEITPALWVPYDIKIHERKDNYDLKQMEHHLGDHIASTYDDWLTSNVEGE